MKYTIWDYDTWGNEYDGYNVNNKWATPYVINLKKNYTKLELVKKMIEAGFFIKPAIDKIDELSINDSGDGVIYIDHKDMPHCELQAMT